MNATFKPSTYSHVYKVARNRGHARIWIEGKRLLDMNARKGEAVSREIIEGRLVLTIGADDGAHKIAGSDARPIIDLCGQWVSALMGDATHYRAAFDPIARTITIQPEA